MRNLSKISPDWWDYTTLDRDILDAAAKLTLEDLPKLQRKGFKINVFDTLQRSSRRRPPRIPAESAAQSAPRNSSRLSRRLSIPWESA